MRGYRRLGAFAAKAIPRACKWSRPAAVATSEPSPSLWAKPSAIKATAIWSGTIASERLRAILLSHSSGPASKCSASSMTSFGELRLSGCAEIHQPANGVCYRAKRCDPKCRHQSQKSPLQDGPEPKHDPYCRDERPTQHFAVTLEGAQAYAMQRRRRVDAKNNVSGDCRRREHQRHDDDEADTIFARRKESRNSLYHRGRAQD